MNLFLLPTLENRSFFLNHLFFQQYAWNFSTTKLAKHISEQGQQIGLVKSDHDLLLGRG